MDGIGAHRGGQDYHRNGSRRSPEDGIGAHRGGQDYLRNEEARIISAADVGKSTAGKTGIRCGHKRMHKFLWPKRKVVRKAWNLGTGEARRAAPRLLISAANVWKSLAGKNVVEICRRQNGG